MANVLEPEDIEWKMVSSWSFMKEHVCQFRNEEFGLQKEVVTNKKALGSYGKPKTYYYMDGQEKPYTVIEELCKDWNEINNFDDPNSVIVWVKVIKNNDPNKKPFTIDSITKNEPT